MASRNVVFEMLYLRYDASHVPEWLVILVYIWEQMTLNRWRWHLRRTPNLFQTNIRHFFKLKFVFPSNWSYYLEQVLKLILMRISTQYIPIGWPTQSMNDKERKNKSVKYLDISFNLNKYIWYNGFAYLPIVSLYTKIQSGKNIRNLFKLIYYNFINSLFFYFVC